MSDEDSNPHSDYKIITKSGNGSKIVNASDRTSLMTGGTFKGSRKDKIPETD